MYVEEAKAKRKSRKKNCESSISVDRSSNVSRLVSGLVKPGIVSLSYKSNARILFTGLLWSACSLLSFWGLS